MSESDTDSRATASADAGDGDDPNALFRRMESTGTKTFALSDDPPVFREGEGARLVDRDGRVYLDLATGSAVSVLGHGHPGVRAALERQIASGITHVGPHFHTESQARAFRRLASVLPAELERLHPATNGAEAVEVALKAAMFRTGNRQFAAFWGAYHGRTAGALAVSTARGANKANGPYLPVTQFLPFPDCPSCPAGTPEACCGKYEEVVFETIVRDWSGAGPLAGIVVEPIQGTAGIRIPPARFLRTLAAAAREAGVPLVFDEIFTGFGRTGRMFAFEHYGIVPDVLVLAKAVGGGVPAGMVAARAGFLDAWTSGTQSSTFQMHPLAAAAGEALIEAVETDELCGRARAIETRFAERRGELAAFDFVSDVRGIGAMHGVEIGREGRPDKALCDAIRRAALARGLVTYECGLAGHVIGLLPPLVITPAELDAAIDTLLEAMRAVGP